MLNAQAFNYYQWGSYYFSYGGSSLLLTRLEPPLIIIINEARASILLLLLLLTTRLEPVIIIIIIIKAALANTPEGYKKSKIVGWRLLEQGDNDWRLIVLRIRSGESIKHGIVVHFQLYYVELRKDKKEIRDMETEGCKKNASLHI